jgi:hypothetical protein
MKRAYIVQILGIFLFGFVGFAARGGDTTPPAGPITSTMKTLDDVEPRTAVNATNTPGDATNLFIISQPGSYYLTGNIAGVAGKSGVHIASDDVTLDLSGFTIRGGSGSLNGIDMNTFGENIVVRNGNVVAWGGNGLSTRIDFGRIEGVVATRNSGWGITNVSGTFTTRIIDCEADGNGFGVANTGGIQGGNNSLIKECAVYANTGAGIQVSSNCTVLQNDCESAVSSTSLGVVGRGIYVLGDANLIDSNSVVNCPTGIELATGGNVMIRNTLRGPTTGGYTWATGNDVAPVSSANFATKPFANIAF